ncbi:hypothetical protein, partial [Streptomyces sp. NRRL WC-3725]|uniref:hypothetical protein n=1 Tax=Streptomyces sp. NRRL WC-3725 TaxID=1463933 RepID=UPI001F1F0507
MVPADGGAVAERRPDRPVPPMAGAAAIGAVVRLPAAATATVAATEEGRDPSSMTASWPAATPTVCRSPYGPASLQVPVEEPAPVLQLEPRGAGVP